MSNNIYLVNIPITVPPVHDTTPCMKYMLAYEECLVDAVPTHMEVFHPSWPTVWPKLLSDGVLRPDLQSNENLVKGPIANGAYKFNAQMPEDVKRKLWECEEERFTFKACLRKLINLEHDQKTRYPFWQPEENIHKAWGPRIVKNKRDRYPLDFHGMPDEYGSRSMENREFWKKFVELGGTL